MEHRQCDSVEAVEKAVETYKSSGKIDSMVEDIRSFRKKLIDAKDGQERNITELEDTLDKITEETEKEINNVIRLIERLKSEYLNEFSAVVKKGKEMLTRNVVTFNDGIQFADFCSDMLEKAKEKDDSTFMKKCCAANKSFQQLRSTRFRTRVVRIMVKKEPILKEVEKIKTLATIEVSEIFHDIKSDIFDLENVQLHLVTKFNINGGCVRNGTFLLNKSFIFSDGKNGKCCYGELSKKEWKLIGDIGSLYDPFGILQKGNELFVTCKITKSIEVFSISDFKRVRSINLDFESFGISGWKEDLYLACGSKIVKIDKFGNEIKKFDTAGSSAFHILVAKSGIIVYTDWKINKVRAISEQWDTAWDYTSPELKCPYGLESDSLGNIYVAGMHSNNIHVLSNSGKLFDFPKSQKSSIFENCQGKK
ncbi:uncharacterized protein LOC133198749 [Saccostrea echinata]|uniref:uncharacterized protein LOC133198749 n=1 Tax=Saccostrea echinata TaxID=191078 RepID=UPI002A7F7F10|nr:uncharacterized protein LOC133198749 [Saccostrea echinata]